MAQIGTFTRGEDGVFTGTIKTLSLNIKARLVPADPRKREGPGPAGAGGQRRDRSRVAPDLEGEHRVSLGQARRSVLPGADLRQPLQGRDRLRARLVALTDRCRDGSPRASRRGSPLEIMWSAATPKPRGKPALRQHHSA